MRVEIDEIIYTRMGDTKINPASPEQLSWLVYGVKVKDKKESIDYVKWAVISWDK